MKTHVERTREEVRRWQVFGDAQRTVDHALDLARMLDAAQPDIRRLEQTERDLREELGELRERVAKYELSDVGFDGIFPFPLTSKDIFDDRRISRSEVANTLMHYESLTLAPT